MTTVNMTFSLDVRIASFIAEHYPDRQQSQFVNQILLDYINNTNLTPEIIDRRIEDIKAKAKAEINKLLDQKEAML